MSTPSRCDLIHEDGERCSKDAIVTSVYGNYCGSACARVKFLYDYTHKERAALLLRDAARLAAQNAREAQIAIVTTARERAARANEIDSIDPTTRECVDVAIAKEHAELAPDVELAEAAVQARIASAIASALERERTENAHRDALLDAADVLERERAERAHEIELLEDTAQARVAEAVANALEQEREKYARELAEIEAATQARIASAIEYALERERAERAELAHEKALLEITAQERIAEAVAEAVQRENEEAAARLRRRVAQERLATELEVEGAHKLSVAGHAAEVFSGIGHGIASVFKSKTGKKHVATVAPPSDG